MKLSEIKELKETMIDGYEATEGTSPNNEKNKPNFMLNGTYITSSSNLSPAS